MLDGGRLMLLATILDVALCTALTAGVVALCVLGHWAMVGRDVS